MRQVLLWFGFLLLSQGALGQDRIIVSGASGQLGGLVIEGCWRARWRRKT
jgi:hypothetical protein